MDSSRRTFLRVVAGAGAGAVPLVRGEAAPALAYIATYSSPQGPEGSKGNGEGIYLFETNPAGGELRRRDLFRNDSNPSWLALHPSKTHLYSANETARFQGTDSGSVSAYSIQRPSGKLELLNTVSSQGAGPCHCSVHPSGRYVFVANYAGGTIAVLPVNADGELGAATDVKRGEGKVGPDRAATAPSGSFAISGHERPHGHMIQSDPVGRFVVSTDLGLDRIMLWRFDATKGVLAASDPPWVEMPPGDGPRHFAFHPGGRRLYSLQEEASTLAVFDYDPASGRLTAKQTLSTLPRGFAGTNFTSEVACSADGRFVYCANRLHDSIAVFADGADGSLQLLGETWTRGDYPRSFTIDPTGNFLYSCNQRSDAVATFRIDRQSGSLTFTGEYTPVGTPAMVLFLT